MDGTFVQELVASITAPQVIEVAGEPQLVLPEGWSAPKREVPRAAALVVHSLTALLDYVRANKDALKLVDDCVVHVKDPVTVELRGKLEAASEHFRRQHYLTASVAAAGPTLPFGNYVDAENFIIGLQAGFVMADDRDSLINFVASIRENTVTDTTDDGFAQKVNVAEGVILVGEKRVPNPVTLRPFRTFREIEQPSSLFVLRLKSAQGAKPLLALFEADGGKWKLDAIREVAQYLRPNLPAGVTVLG